MGTSIKGLNRVADKEVDAFLYLMDKINEKCINEDGAVEDECIEITADDLVDEGLYAGVEEAVSVMDRVIDKATSLKVAEVYKKTGRRGASVIFTDASSNIYFKLRSNEIDSAFYTFYLNALVDWNFVYVKSHNALMKKKERMKR